MKSLFVASVSTAFVLFGTSCASRTSTPSPAPDHVSTYNVMISEPRTLLFAHCDHDTLLVQVMEERQCLRWEYEEYVEIRPDTRMELALRSTARVAGEMTDEVERSWPAPHGEPLPARTRTTHSSSATELVCQTPLVGVSVHVGNQEAVTDEAGGAEFSGVGPGAVVRVDGARWVVCE